MKTKLIILTFLLFVPLMFQNCKKDDKEKENPFLCSFVSSPDYLSYPYFQLTNVSRSILHDIVVECESVMNYPYVPSFTISSINPNTSFTIGMNDGIYWIIGDIAKVKLDGNEYTYYFN